MGRGEEMIDVRKPNRKLTREELKKYSLLSNEHFGDVDFDLLDRYLSDVEIDLAETGIDLRHVPDFSEDGGNAGNGGEKEDKKPEKRELKPFHRTYVFLSFPPEKVLEIQAELERIASRDFVEYEQISK
jgi:hypothetical protein